MRHTRLLQERLLVAAGRGSLLTAGVHDACFYCFSGHRAVVGIDWVGVQVYQHAHCSLFVVRGTSISFPCAACRPMFVARSSKPLC